MQNSRHKELEALKKELDGNYRDPAFSLAFISCTYEGFGVGFSNVAAAAAYGLRIPLIPIYLVGIFVGTSYLLLEIRSTLNDIELQKARLLELERKFATDSYGTYLSFSIPLFEENKKIIDITTLLQNHKVEEISYCLGQYYRQVQEKAKETEKYAPKRTAEILKTLDTKFTAEISQFNSPSLVETLSKACEKEFYTPIQNPPLSRWKRFLNNLRKYYKSALTGAATAGGVTILILTTALTKATVTALFPWSLLGILAVTIIGAIASYKIDKYLDRKRKHKTNLLIAATSHIVLKNQHRVADLFRSTIMALDELNILSKETDKASDYDSSNGVKTTQNGISKEEKPSLSNLDYCEIAELRKQSHKIRRLSDFILPTLLLARGGFAAISSLFAGIGFAGLILPLTPVFITGGCLLLLHIAFKIWNNWVKHQSEFQTMNDLNLQISAEKIHYWQTKFPEIKDFEQQLKTNTNTEILQALKAEYEAFKKQLSAFEGSSNRDPQKLKRLKAIHGELLSLYCAQIDNLNNQTLASDLAETASYVPLSTVTSEKIVTFTDKAINLFSPITRFLATNFKDVLQGIAFGFGLSLTIFLILGITSVVALEAALIVGSTALAGVVMKVAIRHGIKAYRNEHLATLESAGKSIADKETLFDCRAETRMASKRAKTIIEQDNTSLPSEENEFIKAPTWTPELTMPKSRQPLQWYKTEIPETSIDQSFTPAPRAFVC